MKATIKNIDELDIFYLSIKKKHTELTEELMQKDCQRVEFIRGMISVYSEILKEKIHWESVSSVPSYFY